MIIKMYYYYWGPYVLGAVHIKTREESVTAKTNTYTDNHNHSINIMHSIRL